MRAFAERLLLNFRQLQAMSPQQRKEVLKRRLGPKLVTQVQKLKSGHESRHLKRIERQRGITAAHRALWSGPAARRGWPAVMNRILALAAKNPAEIGNFVHIGLRINADPLVLVGLAQHPLTTKALSATLAAERTDPWPELAAQMARPEYAVAFLVATAMTGDDAALDHARARIPDIVNEPFLQLIESFGQRPADAPADIDPILRGLGRSGLRDHKRHRLVIAENFNDPASFLPLLRGADRVTLLGLDDTFGKAVFADYQAYPGIGEIVVEHIRSRITRFSAHYIQAHSQTRDAAIELAALVDTIPGLIPPGNLAHVELAIADHLFFQILRLRAIEELLADTDFDHIVITTHNHNPASGYILTMAGVEGLTRDLRVELISLARTIRQRAGFTALLPAILTGPRSPQVAEGWLPPGPQMAAQLWRNARRMSGALPDRAAPKRNGAAVVLLATTSSPAYDYSTARYVAALSRDFSTALAVCGGTVSAIQTQLSVADVVPGSVPFHLLRREYQPDQTAFARWMLGQINLFCKGRGPQDKVAHMIACAPARLATTIIQAQVMHGLVLEAWFARMAENGGLPDLVALSAVRMATVSQFAAVARRHGVPTLTLEAHGLNANYCRYAKVAADYYGVISEQFRSDAEHGFSMPADRIRAIGTPRIIARPGRDRATARAEFAADLGGGFPSRPGGVVSFFCQPSGWGHVAQVWRLILSVAQQLDLQVLLKPHPEETASRIGQYQAVARQMQAEDRVQLVSTNPALLIEASDVVLTGYSAAALDAAVLGRPVVCVTVGDAVYPVDQHEIARAPLVRDADALRQALQARLGDDAGAARAYADFLRAEPQFAEGPDARLRDFVAAILAAPAIRPATEIPAHLFLDPPHPVFSV